MSGGPVDKSKYWIHCIDCDWSLGLGQPSSGYFIAVHRSIDGHDSFIVDMEGSP